MQEEANSRTVGDTKSKNKRSRTGRETSGNKEEEEAAANKRNTHKNKSSRSQIEANMIKERQASAMR